MNIIIMVAPTNKYRIKNLINLKLISPTAGDEKMLSINLSKKLGFTPDMCEEFKTVLDFSASSPLESGDKKMYRFISKRKLIKNGIEMVLNGVNDFRDWDNIGAFADSFATLLK